MAVNKQSFAKKFAENGLRTVWEDPQYKLGWDMVGIRPPTKEQFNYLFYNIDEKMAFLLDEFGKLGSIKPASTTQAGITQLSSATNSNREDMAATPKSVKAAYDKADSALPVYQRIGNFDVCKFPDGTMIESGTVRVQNHANSPNTRMLTWPMAFTSPPTVAVTMSAPEGNVRDMWVTVDSRQSNQAAVHYWLHEQIFNTPDVTVNFIAIGRWK